MKKLSIILSIIIIGGFFIYALRLVSEGNTCTGVRSFLCQKEKVKQEIVQTDTGSGAKKEEEILQSNTGVQNGSGEIVQQEVSQILVDTHSEQYISMRKIGDSFLHLCDPAITEQSGSYKIDYAACSLTIDMSKDTKTPNTVNVNNALLSQDQIDENLAKFWFSF